MTDIRAKAGGELGLNGEWYKGGEFLPSSATTVKGEFKTAKAKKQAEDKAKRQALMKLDDKINKVLASWYPTKNIYQARELFVLYLKENGVNTWNLNFNNIELAKWVL